MHTREKLENIVSILKTFQPELSIRSPQERLQELEDRIVSIRFPWISANMLANNLNELNDATLTDRLKAATLIVAELNKKSVVYALQPDIIDQKISSKNSAYATLGSEDDYKEAAKIADFPALVPISGQYFPFHLKQVEKSPLDMRVDKTEYYLQKVAKDFMVFLSLAQKKEETPEENQAYLDNFVTPVLIAINKYRETKDTAEKIAAYKEISSPLKKLTDEMYKQAVLVFPEVLEQPKEQKKSLGMGST